MKNGIAAKWPDGLKCPSCLGNVVFKLHDNVCINCGHEIQNRDGILDFDTNRRVKADSDSNANVGSYYRQPDITPSKLNAIVKSAKDGHWFQAIREHLPECHDLMMSMVDTTRVAWLFHCYQESASRAALVVGSQWGTLPIMLSDYYETVFSAHDSLDVLRFQAQRAASDGKDNLVCIRSMPSTLPLKSNSIDLIVINGLLPNSAKNRSVQDESAALSLLLEELRRILSPTGTLYIGAENRFGLLGLDKRNQSGPQLYSLWGYRRLLHKAGFAQLSTYWCWPNHNYPRMSGPFDGIGLKYLADKQKDHLNKAWMRLAVSLFTIVPAALIGLGAKLFIPSFILTASKGDAPVGTLQQQALARSIGVDSFVRLTLSQDARLRTTFLLLKNRVVSKAVRVSRPVDEEVNIIQKTQPCASAQLVAKPCPSSSRVGVKHFRFDESAGVKGRLFRPASRHDIIAAGSWLRIYQESATQEKWSVANLENEINQVAGTIAPILELTSLSRGVESFIDSYLRTVQKSAIPITAEHGDFTLPNLMFSTDEKIQVIDWEHSKPHGHPWMDFGALCLSFLRRGVNSSSATELSPERAIGWFVDGFSSGAPTSKLRNDFKACPAELTVALAPAYYVMRVMNRVISYQPLSAPATYLELQDTWIPLLTLALDYHKQSHPMEISRKRL